MVIIQSIWFVPVLPWEQGTGEGQWCSSGTRNRRKKGRTIYCATDSIEFSRDYR